MDCELCVAQDELYRLVDKNEHCFSLIPTFPIKKGHVMVLPLRHVSMLSDLNDQESKAIFRMVDKLKKSFLTNDYNDPIIFMNAGIHSSQPHLHFHILPSKGALRDLFSNYENIPKRESKSQTQMTLMRDTIRSLLSQNL